jgi:hypothetical protein
MATARDPQVFAIGLQDLGGFAERINEQSKQSALL